MAITPGSVDEYLAGVPSDAARATLSHMRSVILEVAPEVEECIKYGIPTYKFHGFVASIAAFKNHCSFFPGHTVRDFAAELKGFELPRNTKGTVQFPIDKPLPDDLLRAMIRARVDENLAASA